MTDETPNPIAPEPEADTAAEPVAEATPAAPSASPDTASPRRAVSSADAPPRRPDYRGAELDPERGPGLGCFWFQVIVLGFFIVIIPIGLELNWPFELLALLLFIVIGLLLLTGQSVIFLLRLVAADRRAQGRRRPLASPTKTVGELEDDHRVAYAVGSQRPAGAAAGAADEPARGGEGAGVDEERADAAGVDEERADAAELAAGAAGAAGADEVVAGESMIRDSDASEAPAPPSATPDSTAGHAPDADAAVIGADGGGAAPTDGRDGTLAEGAVAGYAAAAAGRGHESLPESHEAGAPATAAHAADATAADAVGAAEPDDATKAGAPATAAAATEPAADAADAADAGAGEDARELGKTPAPPSDEPTPEEPDPGVRQ